MSRHEHVKIAVKHIPEKIMKLHDLEPPLHNGGLHMEMRKSMCGLQAAGHSASDKLMHIFNARMIPPI